MMSSSTVMTKNIHRYFRSYPSGVCVLSAVVGEEIHAMVVSPLSLDPPLVSISISDESASWTGFRHARHIGVSVLTVAHRGLATTIPDGTGKLGLQLLL
ncbi:flavin reductase [Rathayibacter toxicus]|nr:flavin reductase [Rathayibacter toxicus]QOD10344.1 flavin reductase [Rathayibacter toxicus]